MQVDQSFITAIEDKLSLSRLDAYRNYFGCNDDAEVLGLYLWNKALASAYFPLLQAIEITLRNAIHSSASHKFRSSGGREWYLMNIFSSAKAQAEKLYYRGHGTNRTQITPRPTPDHVVSNLMFGFWVNTLTRQFQDIHSNTKLWPALIPSVFPNAEGVSATRPALHRRFKFIKDFRNRIGHYEPLWKIRDTVNGGGVITRQGPITPEQSIERLHEHTELMLDALRWLSVERHHFIVQSGFVDHLKELCSLETLDHYQHRNSNTLKLNNLKNAISQKASQTGSPSGFYNIATSKKGVFKGKDLLLDIRQIRTPRLK